MKDCRGIGTCLAVALLVAAFARADCVPSMVPISGRGVFPNRMARALATNGSIFGLAKVDSNPNTHAIYFTTFNSDLSQLTNDVTVAANSLNGPAILLWNGSEFALFYQALSLTLMLQRIDVSGNLIGAPIALANHSWTNIDEFDVTWVPARNAYAFARTVSVGSDRGLWLTLLSAQGGVESDTNLTQYFNPPAFPHVVALADGTVDLVWARPSDSPLLSVFTISPSGTFGIVSVSQRTVTDMRVATNGTAVLIIDGVPTSSGGTTLRYAEVGAAGLIVPDGPFLSGSGRDIAPRALIWNPALSKWALVYLDAPNGFSFGLPGDTRLRGFASPTGIASDTLLSPNKFLSQLEAPYPPIFLNGAYIDTIARVLSPAEGTESYLVKLCPFSVTATADHPVESPFVPITFNAYPSGGTPGFTFAWDFGDLSTDTGAVVRHAYNVPGTYTVTITATDAAGAQSIFKFTVAVAFLRHRAVR